VAVNTCAQRGKSTSAAETPHFTPSCHYRSRNKSETTILSMASTDKTPKVDEISLFSLGDFELDSGNVLPKAFLAYTTFGDAKNPAIVNPTWYSGCLSLTIQVAQSILTNSLISNSRLCQTLFQLPRRPQSLKIFHHCPSIDWQR